MLVIAACVVVAMIYAYRPGSPSTEMANLEPLSPVGEVKFDYSIVEGTVRAQLRNPNSAKFGPMLAYRFEHLNGRSGIAVCGSVSAKNEAGEYENPKDFVFVSNPVSAVIDPKMPDTRFLSVWKDYCTAH